MIAAPIARGFIKRIIIANPLNPWPYDNFESYTSGSNVNGLNGGWAWTGSFIADGLYFNQMTAVDDMESYSVGQTVSGSNGGTGWGGPMIAS